MPYQKVCKLQSGSFSTVYKGNLTENNQVFVALKCCYKPIFNVTNDNPDYQILHNKFQNKLKKIFKLVNNEYEILNKLRQGSNISFYNNVLNDNNICHMVDFLESSEFYIFVLQYCEFGDLYDHMKLLRNSNDNSHRPINYHKIINQIHQALIYAHNLGIAHRDIKPENILLDANCNAKLTDWGLSTFNLTSLQQCIGTEKYLAPECFFPQYIKKEEYAKFDKIPNYIIHQNLTNINILKQDGYDTIVSDYWSLGITFLYILFASCPFKFAAIQHPSILKKLDKLPINERMNVTLPENKNFQLYINSSSTFIEEYYFQNLLKQESLAISKNTIHAAMNIQDNSHYPAFWLTLLPSVQMVLDMDLANMVYQNNVNDMSKNSYIFNTSANQFIDKNKIYFNDKITEIIGYTIQLLERSIPYRLWLLHQISALITDNLMCIDYLKRDLTLFMKDLNAILQIQVLVLKEFVRQLADLPAHFISIECIDLNQIISNISHIYNNRNLYNNPEEEPEVLEEDIIETTSSDNDVFDENHNNRQFSLNAKNTRGFSNMTLFETHKRSASEEKIPIKMDKTSSDSTKTDEYTIEKPDYEDGEEIIQSFQGVSI
ncbi:hypothetical protein FOG50_03713 [Hanseniaspora uvarum]|nr:hypothetical protein FOG50_03713 [Hanseniaspora uvarum]